MHVKAKRSKEAEEKFRIGYEREEQKCKELYEEKTKEAHTVAKCKEKINLCKEDVALTIKVLIGDAEAVSIATSYALNLYNYCIYYFLASHCCWAHETISQSEECETIRA